VNYPLTALTTKTTANLCYIIDDNTVSKLVRMRIEIGGIGSDWYLRWVYMVIRKHYVSRRKNPSLYPHFDEVIEEAEGMLEDPSSLTVDCHVLTE